MNRTKIDWCRCPDGSQGFTWNPITGCLKKCHYCYAMALANGRLKDRMLGNLLTASDYTYGTDDERKAACADPFHPRQWPSRLGDRGLFQSKPRGIFVCSMGDLFGEGIPEDWTDRVMDQIRIHRQHRFYLLTKQPQNLPKNYTYWPDNCWVGVSATNGQQAGDAVGYLLNIRARVKYISFEPLLERIEISDQGLSPIDWVIIGAQTKPTVMPKVEWVKEIVEAADGAGIPVFLKDSLKPLFAEVEEPGWLVGWENCPGELRQEFPKGV